MRIDGPGKTSASPAKKAEKKRASGASFTDSLKRTAAADRPAAAHAAGSVAAVDALLALQESETAGEGRSRGLKRAADMLDLLEDVRHGILLGAIPKPRLKALAALARSRREAEIDPKLAEILDDIELRAEVELAKLEA